MSTITAMDGTALGASGRPSSLRQPHPIMLKSDANPEGLPMEVFDGMRAGVLRDRYGSKGTSGDIAHGTDTTGL